jgi:hypothetical protein
LQPESGCTENIIQDAATGMILLNSFLLFYDYSGKLHSVGLERRINEIVKRSLLIREW